MLLWVFSLLIVSIVQASDVTQSPETEASMETGLENLDPTAMWDKDGNLLPENACNEKIAWQSLENKSGLNNQWNSIGNIQGLGGNCTANLVVPPKCGNYKNQKAQVITNGHCVKAGVDQAGSHVTFRMFKDIPKEERLSVNVNQVLFTDMSRIDLAIVELDFTYQQLEQLGITPKKIATNDKAQEFTNIAIPQTCPGKEYIHRSQCKREKSGTVMDGYHIWENQFVANCSATPGSSGSGLYDTNGELSAIFNSGGVNEKRDGPDCQIDTCFFDGNGFPQREMQNYALDVSRLHKCYSNCKLDTKIEGCELPKNQPGLTLTNTNTVANWITNLNQSLTLQSTSKEETYTNIKVKACSQSDSSCTCDKPDGYKQAYEKDIQSPMGYHGFKPSDYISSPTKPTFYKMCVLGKRKDGSWESTDQAFRFPLFYH